MGGAELIRMVTTTGKAVIFIGFLVLLTGLFVTMSTLVGLFMIFAGIITMIQGANMKPLAEPNRVVKQDTQAGSHYSTGIAVNRDPKNKGAV